MECLLLTKWSEAWWPGIDFSPCNRNTTYYSERNIVESFVKLERDFERGIVGDNVWCFFSTIEMMLQRSGIIVESLLKSRGSLRGVLRVITCRGGSFYNWNDVVERWEYCGTYSGENWWCPWNDVVERLLWKVWLKSSPVRDNLGWKRPMGLQPPHLFISINRTNTKHSLHHIQSQTKIYTTTNTNTNESMGLQPPHLFISINRTNTKHRLHHICTITNKNKPMGLQQNKYIQIQNA